jgi:peptidoglycan-associated lipoprotein
MITLALRVITIAALASSTVVAATRPLYAQPELAASEDATPSQSVRVLAQASASVVPPPAPDQSIGLPRIRDYYSIAELRDIYFDFGKAVIRPEDVNVLDATAAWLRANPAYRLLIEGHCDNRGTTNRKNELNVDLGERRAQAAMNHLVARGVEPSRITVLSYGEERPQCTEQNERCWSQNRRARFLVRPL